MRIEPDDERFSSLLPNARPVTMLELRSSHNDEHYWAFQKFVRDGAELKGALKNEDNIPSLDIKVEGVTRAHFVWLFPKMMQFVLRYLLSGDTSDIPKYPKDGEVLDSDIPKYPKVGETLEYRSEANYIDRHIKREIERNSHTCNEETQDGVNGIRFIGKYPYGSIDYGFFPYSFEELKTRLENVEAFYYGYSERDIPDLHYNNNLPIEEKALQKGNYLDSALDDNVIPTNTIIDKTICGIGATWMEIHSKRNSIIIEPNMPVIIGKAQKHPEIIEVYGDIVKAKDIAEKIQNQTGYVKIMTTPDSYWKVKEALKPLNPFYYKDYFLLFDECEKIISDIDYRPNIALPIDDFFRFKNKAMVSATPIVINDPRFKEQGFKVIEIKPQFDYKRLLELKPTNNVNAMVKRTVEKINKDKDAVICFFYNSIKGIKEVIELLGTADKCNIYCSTEARKELKKDGYNVYDSVTDKDGNIALNKYNFFTSRFYSAVDIELPDTDKPIVIMITAAYKTKKDKTTKKYETPYSLIDPETEAIQIAGRFRKGIARLIHITDTNLQLEFRPREELEQFLKEQHDEFLNLLKLNKEAKTDGGKHITWQAVTKVDYCAEGYVSLKGEVNYFRYNNAYLDERLKMLYTYPAPLYKAYRRSEAFTVISESEYAIYTDEERRKLENGTHAQKIEALNDLIKRDDDSISGYDYLFIQEQKQKYAFWVEALMTIGLARMRELEFKDSDIRTVVNDFKFDKQVRGEEVIKDVYKIFEENHRYTIREITTPLKEIFREHNLQLHRQPKGEDITYYFKATYNRTGRERGWKLANRLYTDL